MFETIAIASAHRKGIAFVVADREVAFESREGQVVERAQGDCETDIPERNQRVMRHDVEGREIGKRQNAGLYQGDRLLQRRFIERLDPNTCLSVAAVRCD